MSCLNVWKLNFKVFLDLIPRVILLEQALLLVCSPLGLHGGAALGAVDMWSMGILIGVYEAVPHTGREAGIMEGRVWWHKF